jgi:hypothetical protein
MIGQHQEKVAYRSYFEAQLSGCHSIRVELHLRSFRCACHSAKRHVDNGLGGYLDSSCEIFQRSSRGLSKKWNKF